MSPVDLSHLPSLQDRPRCAKEKPSRWDRFADRIATKRTHDRLAELWRTAVWKRDRARCRCCGVAVERTRVLKPTRGEVHHVMARQHKPTQTDVRNGLLLCAWPCHARVTGDVGHKLVIVGSAFFELPSGRTYINADAPVTFREAV